MFSPGFTIITIFFRVKEATPETPVNNPAETPMAMNRFIGTFDNGLFDTVTGSATIYLPYNNQYILTLENFNSSNGPDLHVYISKEVQPVIYIESGRLRSVGRNSNTRLLEISIFQNINMRRSVGRNTIVYPAALT